MMAKSNDTEHTKRINKVYDMLINGYRRYEICQFVLDSTDWGVSESQVDRYMADATKLIKENAKQTQEEFMEEAKARFRDLYKKAMSQKDVGECRRIMDTANKVLGYEKLNLDVTGSTTIKVELPKE